MPNIYVLNKDGTPMMPSHSYGRVKRMLRTGKARIFSTNPDVYKRQLLDRFFIMNLL